MGGLFGRTFVHHFPTKSEKKFGVRNVYCEHPTPRFLSVCLTLLYILGGRENGKKEDVVREANQSRAP